MASGHWALWVMGRVGSDILPLCALGGGMMKISSSLASLAEESSVITGIILVAVTPSFLCSLLGCLLLLGVSPYLLRGKLMVLDPVSGGEPLPLPHCPGEGEPVSSGSPPTPASTWVVRVEDGGLANLALGGGV